MVKREARERKLQVTLPSSPSFFRCPISLEVMKSPVSLCTGVTYDRSSIKTWLDAGHSTCPSTMQSLSSKELIPNLTIRNLIALWSAKTQHDPSPEDNPGDTISSPSPLDLLSGIDSADSALSALEKLAAMAADQARALEIAETGRYFVAVLNRVLRREEAAEMVVAVRILSLVLPSGKENLAAELDFGAIIRLIGVEEDNPEAVDCALSCLIIASEERRARPGMVENGIVGALRKVLERESTHAAVEKALKLMERMAACAEGRAAICEDTAAVPAVVGRMKAAPPAAEHAIAVVWTVCFLFRDRRAQEAVAASNGLAKILLVMQSNCSAVARGMAGELFKLFFVNHGGCLLSGRDLQTTHIMPF